jgi:ABC-type multidrug transport system permease subunit
VADVATLHPTEAPSRPQALRLVASQFRSANRQFRRTPVMAFLTLALPLLFLLLVGLATGNATVDGGIRYAQFYTPGLLAFAIATATFTTPAIAISIARSRGVLKRLRGTPLPAWTYLAGHMLSALAVALVSSAVMLAVAVVAFDVQVFAHTVPAALLTLLLGAVTFGALAFAAVALIDSTTAVETVANGTVIALAFVSDVFMSSETMPAWLRTVGDVFPLKHFARGLADAFDPFATAGALDWRHLAVMGAWAVGASVVALLRFSWEPDGRVSSAVRAPGDALAPVDGTRLRVIETGRRQAMTLLWAQIRYANRALWRDPGSVFFAVAFPVLLLLLIPTVFGTGELPWADGMRFPQWYAPAMAVYGIAVHAFVNVPEGVARARDTGVLRRLRGTPLPSPLYLAGRLGSIVLVALLIMATTMIVGVLVYGVDVPVGRLPVAAVTLLVGTVSLAALGLMVAAVVPSAGTVPAVALAFLLPLSFVSDIFMLGELPAAMSAVGWAFPLKHFVHAMVGVFDSGSPAVDLVHLAAMAGWGVVGAVVAAVTFRWEAGAGGSRG